MSIYIDRKFINQISSQLGRFKWKKENLASCRCPICGDSKKNPNKCRGFFFEKGSDYFYKCHNCGVGHTLYKFLELVSPAVCKEYALERYRSGENGHSNYKKPKETDMFKFTPTPKFKKKDEVLDTIECIKDLPKDHIAVRFVNIRKIPKEHWGLLYYTDDFGSFAKELDPTILSMGKEERLVIPFFNSHGHVVGCQGRSLIMQDEMNARETLKYITVKYDKSIDRLWYGLWRVNPNKRVYVVEGPLDSLFLQNATAMVGAGALKEIPSRFDDTPMTYILDNEPRNRQICSYIEKLIELGREVCIWPDNIVEKDINDMAYQMSTRKIQKMIDDNTVSGLEATLKFREWRKV
jgi:hypothetical protein